MREKLMHFINVGSSTTASYVLLGDGIESLTEEFNPTIDTKQYINQSNATSRVTSYAPAIDVSREYILNDELQTWLDERVRTLPTGVDAETDYIRLNVYETTSTASVYKAVKRKCAVAINSTGGDAGAEIIDGFSINGMGDGIQGTFNVSSKTFTPSV